MNWLYSLPDLYQLSGLLIVCLMFLILLLCLKKLQHMPADDISGGTTGFRQNLHGRLGHPLGLLLLTALASTLLFTLGLLTMLRLRQNGLLADACAMSVPGQGGLELFMGLWIGAALLPLLMPTGLWLARRPAPVTTLVVAGILLMLWRFFMIVRLGWTATPSGQAAPPFSTAFRQASAFASGLGVLLLAGVSGLPLLRKIGQDYRARLGLALMALALTVVAGFFGPGVPGKGPGLTTGSLVWQLAELVNVFFVIGLAACLNRLMEARRGGQPCRREWVPLALLLLTILALALQHAYGNALLLALVMLALAWCCPPFRWWAPGGLTMLAAVLLLCLYLHRPAGLYEQFRTWRYPFSRHEQVAQALWGIAGGGWCGAGPGRGGSVLQLAVQDDFAAVWMAEEFGLAGMGLLLLAYATLTLGGFALAARIAGPYGNLLATGFVFLLASQALLNLAGASNLIPVTGIALPFLSRGGGALLTACLALGLMIASGAVDHA